MIGLAMALALAVSDPLPVPSSSTPPAAMMQQLRLQCRDADMVLQTLAKGLDAEKAKDFTGAKAAYEAVISNCGSSHASDPARVFRAKLAWREKDYAGVLSWLKDVPRAGPSRLNLLGSMLAMSADRELNDPTAFGQERAQVQARVEQALSSQGQRLDSFSVNGAQVTAYKVDLVQGAFTRLIVFTVAPQDPMALPETVMLTDDQNAHAMAKQLGTGAAPYFLDAYTCLSHATVKMLPGHGDQPPDYAEVKPLAVDYLTTRHWATSQGRPEEMACAWPQFVAPGASN